VARFAAGMILARLREPGRLAKQLSGVASGFFVLLGVSRRRTLDSLLGGHTSKGSTCDAADDRPWRTTDDRACHFPGIGRPASPRCAAFVRTDAI
jgi:hypothetical protein